MNTKVIIVVVLLVASGVTYFMLSGRQNNVGSRTGKEVRVKCLSCQKESDLKVEVSEEQPYKCPACGKREAWRMYQCYDSGKLFVPDREGNPPRLPMIITCPDGGAAGPAPLIE